MSIEELLPRIVIVSKNLKNEKFSFEVQEGTLTKTEKKLFTEDSDIVILKDCYGHGIDYSNYGNKKSEIVNGIPTTKSIYVTYKRSQDERRRV